MAKQEQQSFEWLKNVKVTISRETTSVDCSDPLHCKGGRRCVQLSRFERAKFDKVYDKELLRTARDCASLCPQIFGAALKMAKEGTVDAKRKETIGKSLDRLKRELRDAEAALNKIPFGKKDGSKEQVRRNNLRELVKARLRKKEKNETK